MLKITTTCVCRTKTELTAIRAQGMYEEDVRKVSSGDSQIQKRPTTGLILFVIV